MLGERLVELRKKHGLSQKELSKQLYVTRQAISKWENNQSRPDIDTLKKLSIIYGISVDEILKDNSLDNDSEEGLSKKNTPKKKSLNKNGMMIFSGIIILIVIVILSSFISARIEVTKEITSDDIIMLTPTEKGKEMIKEGETQKVSTYEDITGNVICFVNTYYLHGIVIIAFLLIFTGIKGHLRKRSE